MDEFRSEEQSVLAKAKSSLMSFGRSVRAFISKLAAGRKPKQVERDDTTRRIRAFMNSDQLIARLNPADAGRTDGVNNTPSSSSEEVTPFEGSVLGHCNDALQLLKDDTVRLLRDIVGKLTKFNIPSVVKDIELCKSQLHREVRTCRDEHSKDLVNKFTTAMMWKRNFLKFRRDHNRYAPPITRITWVGAIAMLFFMISLESIVNANLFKEASNDGLVGGWLFAAMVSLINILCSFGFGYFVVKNIYHVEPVHRALSWLGIVIFVTISSAFHLGVGHYRQLLETQPALAKSQAFRMLYENTFGIANFDAWLLVALGFFLGVVAIIEGLHTNDPYPGYSRIADIKSHAEIDFRNALKKFNTDLREIEASTMGRVNALIDGQEAKLANYLNEVRNFEVAASSYDENRLQIESVCARVLQVYRDENKQVRTSTPPAYFVGWPKLNTELSYDTENTDSRQTEFIYIVDADKNLAEQAKTYIHEEMIKVYNSQEDYLSTVEGISKEEVHELLRDFESAEVIERLFPRGGTFHQAAPSPETPQTQTGPSEADASAEA